MRVEPVDVVITRELRRRVLRPTFTPDDPLPGDAAAGVIAVAALTDENVVIGTCLALPQPCEWRAEQPAWRLRAMAVDPDARTTGIGTAVLSRVLEVVRTDGGALAWCRARETAAGFWTRNSFRSRYSEGDPRQVYDDDETGVPHRDMWRLLV